MTTKRFDPLEMLEVRKAVLARKKKFRVRGKNFTLRYDGKQVFFRPEKGYAPCGWLTIARVENYIEDAE
jgi:hypothetical protein